MLKQYLQSFFRRPLPRLLLEEPRRAEYAAADHDAVAAVFLRLRGGIAERSDIAVADDERLRAYLIPQSDNLRHRFPVRRHIRHFFARPQMDRQSGQSLLE